MEKWDTYHYVPLPSLKNLLKDETVLEQLEQTPNRVNYGGSIEDFCDGTRFSNHPLFSSDPQVIQILAYYDELELCNLLGSHVKKTKLVSYFTHWGTSLPSIGLNLSLYTLHWLLQSQ